MGDAVNLASRLEGITKEYGADIIVGEDTKEAVPDVVFREIDRVRVKGKDTAVAIFEPLGLKGEVEKAKLDESEPFDEALELYRKQEWDMAELRLARAQEELRRTRALYEIFLERIAICASIRPARAGTAPSRSRPSKMKLEGTRAAAAASAGTCARPRCCSTTTC